MNNEQTRYLLITTVAMCVQDGKNNTHYSARVEREFFLESNM